MVELCRVRLRFGDSLATLGAEYSYNPRQILTDNRIPFDRWEIDKWVMDMNGRRFPFDDDEPFADDPSDVPQAHRARIAAELNRTGARFPLGWAAFTEQAVIMLPKGRRPCVDVSTGAGASPSAWGFGLLLAGVAAYAVTR